MRRPVKNKKVSVTFTMEQDVIELIKENFHNRSKFVENCVIEELCKSEKYKQILMGKKIVL